MKTSIPVSLLLTVLLSSQFSPLVQGQETLPVNDGSVSTINDLFAPTLTTGEFTTMLQDEFFDVIVDVRTEEEFAAGHIVGATLVEGLAEDPSMVPTLLQDCNYCDIVVYGSSDEQASNASQNLRDFGFVGRLNTLETDTSTTRSGLMVSTDPSVVPPCSTDTSESDLCYNKYLSYQSQLVDSEGQTPDGSPGEDSDGPGTSDESVTGIAEVDFIAIQTLTPAELNGMIENGDFNVIIDTRSSSDFTAGHLPGATLVSGLSSGSSASSLEGCEYCTIVVYGDSVENAADALTNLRELGFEGRLYNGQSTTEWEQAGFNLVADTTSVDPPCSSDESVSNQCRNAVLAYSGGEADSTSSPTASPSTKAPDDTSAANILSVGTMLLLSMTVCMYFI